MTTYGYTILYVADVAKTLAFYVAAFGCTQKFLTPDQDYGELETGSTTLAFAAYKMADFNGFAISKQDPNALPAPCELAFISDDVEALYTQAIAAGAHALQPPTQKPWGQTVAYVRDLNGFLVELCTKITTL